MDDSLKIGTVILLLMCMLTVMILPSVSLEPTALRAANLASLFFALLALGGTMLAACIKRPMTLAPANFDNDYSSRPVPDLVGLNCTRLC